LKTSEVYYILEGEGIMHVDDESAAVHAGQAIYVPPNSNQHISNTGDSDLRFLCIVDPAWQPQDEEVL
jgi:mannose-6-phosphate isomerase-like protein (cupin superfamily)